MEWKRRHSRSTSAWWMRSRNSLKRWMPSRWTDSETLECAQVHLSLCPQDWQGMVHFDYPAFILPSAHKSNGISQREFPPLCSSNTSPCIYSGECKLVEHFGDEFLLKPVQGIAPQWGVGNSILNQEINQNEHSFSVTEIKSKISNAPNFFSIHPRKTKTAFAPCVCVSTTTHTHTVIRIPNPIGFLQVRKLKLLEMF